jgi:hypothetical protein
MHEFSCNFAASASVKIDANKFFKIISTRWIFFCLPDLFKKLFDQENEKEGKV